MEIEPIETFERDDGILEIKKFKYKAICLLGEKYTAAIPNASAKLIKFSKVDFQNECKKYNNIFSMINTYSIPENIKKEIDAVDNKNPMMVKYFSNLLSKDQVTYNDIIHIDNIINDDYKIIKNWCKNIINYADTKIKINNSKEVAIDSKSWDNPGSSLYDKLMEASNASSLINEAYLVIGNDYKNNPSTELKYPHHTLKSGELVINIAGLEAAGSRLNQIKSQNKINDSAYIKALNHINKHRKELGMDKLEKFSTTYNNLIGMANQIVKEKDIDEYGIPSYSVMDIDEANVYCNKSGYTVAIPYAMEDENMKIDFQGEKKVIPVVNYVDVKEDQDMNNLQNYYSSSREVLGKIKDELEDIKLKYASLQKTNEELYGFKVETENKQKQCDADALYEKYKDFINKEDIEKFNNILFSVEDFTIFKEKFSNFVLPKVEAVIKNKTEKRDSNKTNTLDFNITGITKPEVDKKDKDDIFKKLESI